LGYYIELYSLKHKLEVLIRVPAIGVCSDATLLAAHSKASQIPRVPLNSLKPLKSSQGLLTLLKVVMYERSYNPQFARNCEQVFKILSKSDGNYNLLHFSEHYSS